MASLLASQALSGYEFEELGADEASSDESDDSDPRCRICYEKSGELLRPCACDGSMAFVHGSCLGKWLAAQAPHGVSRHCDVCRAPWRVVTEPTVGRFLKSLLFGGRGSDAIARLLRHVSEPRHVRVHWEGEDDDILAEDEDEDVVMDRRAEEEEEGEEEDDEHEEEDEEDEEDDDDLLGPRGAAWEAAALGLPGFVPHGGLVGRAAAAIARLALWSAFFFAAVGAGNG